MKAGIGDRLGRAMAITLALSVLLLAGCSHESADWKQATLANSTEAYQAFLQQHPHSPEAVQAQMRIKELSAQRDWQIASTADTRDAYQQFVTAHPDSKWVQEARLRIENFAQAGASGTPLSDAGAGGAAGTSTPASTGTAAATGAATGAATAAPALSAHAAARSPSRTSATARRHGARVASASSTHARAHAGRVVQLGAFSSKSRAQSEWKMLCARVKELRSLTPHYVPGRSRGARVYRLQVHMSSPGAASGLCATLKRHARACLRVNA